MGSNFSRCIFWAARKQNLCSALATQPIFHNLKKLYAAQPNEHSFEVMKNLHMNWYIHAVKALMGQLGKQLYQQLNKGWKADEALHFITNETLFLKLSRYINILIPKTEGQTEDNALWIAKHF